jgi:hypothetical protein
MTPHRLAPMLPSLPPILHNAGQNSTPSCSKGPRGLSVLPQQTSIFTRTSISPGLWLRQWGSRYAIRAGQNLPDKEFRYLRHDCYCPNPSADEADVSTDGQVISAWLHVSPRGSDCLIMPVVAGMPGVQSLRIPALGVVSSEL